MQKILSEGLEGTETFKPPEAFPKLFVFLLSLFLL